jgi:hypothetical protein
MVVDSTARPTCPMPLANAPVSFGVVFAFDAFDASSLVPAFSSAFW